MTPASLFLLIKHPQHSNRQKWAALIQIRIKRATKEVPGLVKVRQIYQHSIIVSQIITALILVPHHRIQKILLQKITIQILEVMPEWVLWPLATKTWICKHKLYSPKFSTRTADLALALAPMPWKTRHHGIKSTTRAQAMLSRKQSEAVLPKSTSRSHKTLWWLARWLSWEFSRMSQLLHLMFSRVRTALLVRTVATVGYSRTQI